MNFRIFSPDLLGRVDPPVMRFLARLPQGNDIVVVPITRLDNFTFNAALPQFIGGRPWVLVDFSEMGWDYDQEQGYVWGKTRLNHPWFQTNEYARLDDFIRKNPPFITFQRELLEQDRRHDLIPMEYPSYCEPIVPDTEDQFASRPIDVFYVWGRSSEVRVRLHANIWRQSSYKGYHVVGSLDHISSELRECQRGLWCSAHIPHYARKDVSEVIKLQTKAKIVVSMPGCGQKTFRGGEIPNSIIALAHDNLAWSVPLIGGENCIRLSSGIGVNSITHDRENIEVEELTNALKQQNLYILYLRSIAASDSIRVDNYMRDWFVGNVKKAKS